MPLREYRSIQYTVTLSPPLDDPGSWVVECNCSICARNGYLNVYVRNECVEFEDGAGLEDGGVKVSRDILSKRMKRKDLVLKRDRSTRSINGGCSTTSADIVALL